MARAAVAAVLGIAILGALMYFRPGPQPLPPPAPANSLAPAVPSPSAFAWRLTGAMSAHRALVLEVETTRPEEAVMIAQQLTPMYCDRFDEILVYFFEPVAHPRLATLRVEWTRARGYRTLTLRPSP